ncbi:MAG TPA: penicillin-binding protein 1B, partial [Candidatus Tenderia electrophaga]|nr:penicillin-binding protein 1B [Candidatus Tenderia electrophaga]
QQLVKNFFLNRERSLIRKINEAIMSLLLELHYEKKDILEAYANEIYLGQDGNRAIHGFGLAAKFYFNKPPQELTIAESVLLVAILRGPTYYDPRRHPERALERRNKLLQIIWRDGLIDKQQAQTAMAAGLGVTPKPRLGSSRYPAFIALVKRQLQQDYRDDDLRSEGLRIFSSLDPVIQQVAEKALVSNIKRLERQPGLLEGGVVISRLGSAEVSAVVGGRQPRFDGFNRALDIQRPVGSLLKPALYLTALSQPHRYTLASQIDDAPIKLKQSDGSIWSPANYDHKNHGKVLLADALIHSYNQAAVRLGLELGLGQVADTLHELGIEERIPPYPAVMLGSLELAPLDIAQMYQTLADEGFYTPLRAVRAVLDAKHQPLNRYSLDTQQRFAPEQTFLVNDTLRLALREGTGRSVARQLPRSLALAGKTGTTDDLRDSWFAGFGSDYLGVVWLGNDNNAVIGLTGASGALRVWADIMGQINVTQAAPAQPANIEYVAIDATTGLLAGSGCQQEIKLAFIAGTAPGEYAPCAGGAVRRSVGGFLDRLKGWFR